MLAAVSYRPPAKGNPSDRRKRAGGSTGATGVRLFAHAVPGIGRLLGDELDRIDGVKVQDSGFDGRSDVVLFTATHPKAVVDTPALRLAEDLFVEVGRTLRSEGDRAPWIARRLWKPARAQRALADLAGVRGSVRDRATFRVVARVLQERSFVRTELRRHFSDAVQHTQARWRFSDPADVEVWVLEYQQGRFVAGLRASDVQMRQHGGRVAERSGALRPTVASAMVRLAGEPGLELLDPCCGSGTILEEAAELGWKPVGRDIDPDAVALAARNVSRAAVAEGDARRLDLADGSVDAVVSNLPFGRQFGVDGDMNDWLRSVLDEMVRVTRPGGTVVLLAPAIPRSALPAGLRASRSVPVRVLGTKATIWVYDRR
jgi:23S rRNA G2445 N2-methylase RlmL